MTAKGYIETDRQVQSLLEDVRSGIFKPIYLLMGPEPYYPDMLCSAIEENCLQEWERDFNQLVCYGGEVDAEKVITAARRFPMMAERQLVVLKEAQQMKSLEDLSFYCENPLDSTVLVILMHGASADKRRSLYKSVLKNGVVVDSQQLRDYEIPRWIEDYYHGRSLEIDPDAAVLLAEYAGSDLGKIAVETEKLLKNLPEGCRNVRIADIEKNVGMSRQFSIFELTKALSMKDAAQAFKIAAYMGSGARFMLQMVMGALHTHFMKLIRYGLLLRSPDAHDPKAKAAALQGVNPYYYREYDTAVRNYPPEKCLRIMNLLADYDFKGKGDGGEATQGELLTELVGKILVI